MHFFLKQKMYFVLSFTRSSPCRKGQRISLPFYSLNKIVVIELIHLHNCEIRHHSTVCRCGQKNMVAGWNERREHTKCRVILSRILYTYRLHQRQQGFSRTNLWLPDAILLFLAIRKKVAILHRELEHKVEKVKHMKLEVLRLKTKNNMNFQPE